jgi:hypothetical protein
MAPTGRIFHRGEQPDPIFSSLAGQQKFNRYFYLRIGEIIDIRPDQYMIKVEWKTGKGDGSPDWITMSFPYVGPAGCIGAYPEIGALGIFGFADEGSAGGKGTPLLLSYVNSSLQSSLDYNWKKLYPDSIPNEEENIVFTRFRKLAEGDLIVASKFGGELFVNKDIEIRDGSKDTILLRNSDQSIIMTSLNNFQFSNGASVAAGAIMRNMVNIFDSVGTRIANRLSRECPLPDGRTVVYLVPGGTEIDENTQFYSEYRIDVDDLVDGKMDINDINSRSSLSTRDPIVTMVMGNYAGANGSDNRYGKILRPILFTSPIDTKGNFDLVECVQNKGMDEVGKLGLAWAIHLLKNNAFMGFDKEGQFYLNLGTSSSANPSGAGRSISILSPGALKESYGASAYDGNSWDLSTTGGIRWNIGAHTGKAKSRSIDIKTSSGMKLEIRNNDDDKFAKQEYIYGNQKVSIGGSEETEISGDSTLKVDGLRKEEVKGSAVYQYQSGNSLNVMGKYTISVSDEMQGKYNKRKETISLGQELEILTGDNKDSIKTFGSKKTTLTLGSIEETILAGSRKVSITTKGDIVMSTVLGKIDLKTLVGSGKISALNDITLQGPSPAPLIKADIKGLKVNLGYLPTQGGVVVGMGGVPSHFDYCTGAPLKGSMTVKASI